MSRILSSHLAFPTLRILPMLTFAALSSCADPGSGGSGVPTGSAGQTNSSQNGTQGAAGTAPTTIASEQLRGVVDALTLVDPVSVAQAQIVVSGYRVDIGQAVLLDGAGNSRPFSDLQVGSSVRIRYQTPASLESARVGTQGPALLALEIILSSS